MGPNVPIRPYVIKVIWGKLGGFGNSLGTGRMLLVTQKTWDVPM